MANYYFDLASGNDTTGDGTAGNPWKTIDKCTTSRSAGDECRGAKTPITTLSGTLTFTNGSTSVATSADQTAVVAAGDLIGKNSGLEGWWKVASLNATTITLTYQYWGLSGSGSAVTGYKVTPVTASERYDMNSSGSSSAYIKVSGGWDLTGPTQDGITAVYYATAAIINSNSKNYIELSKFILSASGQTDINVQSVYGWYIHDVWTCDGGYHLDLNTSSECIIENFVGTGGVSQGVRFYHAAFNKVSSLYMFSTGTSTDDFGLFFTVTSYGNFLKDVRVYNSYSHNIRIDGECGFNFFRDPILSTTRIATGYNVSFDGYNNRFYGGTLDGATSYAILSNNSGPNYFINGSISSGTGEYSVTGNAQSFDRPQLVIQNTGADSRMIFYDGVIEHDSSASCRSESCIKLTPTSATVPIGIKAGSVKVSSSGSNITLKIYIKDDGSFNGSIYLMAAIDGEWTNFEKQTFTSSFVQKSVVVSSSDLIADKYVDLYIMTTGTAGSVFVDDFSADQ